MSKKSSPFLYRLIIYKMDKTLWTHSTSTLATVGWRPTREPGVPLPDLITQVRSVPCMESNLYQGYPDIFCRISVIRPEYGQNSWCRSPIILDPRSDVFQKSDPDPNSNSNLYLLLYSCTICVRLSQQRVQGQTLKMKTTFLPRENVVQQKMYIYAKKGINIYLNNVLLYLIIRPL